MMTNLKHDLEHAEWLKALAVSFATGERPNQDMEFALGAGSQIIRRLAAENARLRAVIRQHAPHLARDLRIEVER